MSRVTEFVVVALCSVITGGTGCGDDARLRGDAGGPSDGSPPDAAPDAPPDMAPDAAPAAIYDPANTGFHGTVCFNGLKYATPNLTLPYVVACTEDAGVFKTTLGDPLTWVDMNAGGITNLHGRGIATNPAGPPIYYIADAAMTNNGFRSSNQGGTWVAQSISDAGTPRELFAFAFRMPLQTIAGAWDPVMGALVLHGNPPGLMVHTVGATAGAVTGTPRGLASGGVSDVFVAVYGKTPAGDAATGGIFRACDLTTTGGGTYEERDTGSPPATSA